MPPAPGLSGGLHFHLRAGESRWTGTHKCLDSCHVYGWHAFRYAHATFNYGRVTDRELMDQMGQSSQKMFEHYTRVARLNQARVYDAYVPGRKKDGGKSDLNVVG